MTGAGAAPARFREVIGEFPTGVAVITCEGPDGPAGLTTNAVTSLSLDPLLMLVCFDNSSRTLEVVRTARRFAVNFLTADQEDVARVFASKRVAREKFDGATHRIAHGVPVLDGALAWIACDVRDLLPGGDHTIAVGAATHMAVGGGEPLVFHRGRYLSLASEPRLPLP